MPLLFLIKDGRLSVASVSSPSVLDIDNMEPMIKPSSDDLASLTKTELREVLKMGGKKITNFARCDKQRAIHMMLDSWSSIMETIAVRNNVTVFNPDEFEHHLVDDDDYEDGEGAEAFLELGYSADPPSDDNKGDIVEEKKTTAYINLTVKRNKFDDDCDGFIIKANPNMMTFKDIATSLYMKYGLKMDGYKFMFNDMAIDNNHTVGKYSMEDFTVYLLPLMVGGGVTRVRKNIIKQKMNGDPATRATDTSIYENGFKGAEAILKLESVKITDFVKSLSATELDEVKNMLFHGRENNDVKLQKLADYHVHGKPLRVMLFKAEYAMEHLKEVLQQSIIDEFGGRDGRFMSHFKKFIEDTARLQEMQS